MKTMTKHLLRVGVVGAWLWAQSPVQAEGEQTDRIARYEAAITTLLAGEKPEWNRHADSLLYQEDISLETALPYIIQSMNHEESAIRLGALRALRAYKTPVPAALPVLMRMSASADAGNSDRSLAISVLGELYPASKEASDLVYQLLTTSTSLPEEVRTSALDAGACFGANREAFRKHFIQLIDGRASLEFKTIALASLTRQIKADGIEKSGELVKLGTGMTAVQLATWEVTADAGKQLGAQAELIAVFKGETRDYAKYWALRQLVAMDTIEPETLGFAITLLADPADRRQVESTRKLLLKIQPDQYELMEQLLPLMRSENGVVVLSAAYVLCQIDGNLPDELQDGLIQAIIAIDERTPTMSAGQLLFLMRRLKPDSDKLRDNLIGRLPSKGSWYMKRNEVEAAHLRSALFLTLADVGCDDRVYDEVEASLTFTSSAMEFVSALRVVKHLSPEKRQELYGLVPVAFGKPELVGGALALDGTFGAEPMMLPRSEANTFAEEVVQTLVAQGREATPVLSAVSEKMGDAPIFQRDGSLKALRAFLEKEAQ